MTETFSEETVNRIIVGLGGQGCRIVDMVATYLDSNGGIPPNEAFIFIDSNDEDLGRRGLNITKSFQPIIHKKSLPMSTRQMFMAENPWFPEQYTSIVSGMGAGQRRVFGKGLYNIHKGDLKDILNRTATDLITKTRERSFVVVLVGALGGGTGSSIIGDISIDIRNWFQSNYGKEPIIFGFGIMPSMDEERTTVGNAMATLKELHFIMSQKEKSGRYLNPFTLFILAGREVRGVKDDDVLRKITLRFLVDLGFAPGKKKPSEDKWFDLNDLINAVTEFKSSFSTIGFHMVEFPADEILLLFEDENLIKDLNSKITKSQAEINSTKDLINNTENELEVIRTNIDKLDVEVNSISNGWFSEKQNIEKAKEMLELAKQSYQDTLSNKLDLSTQLKWLESKKRDLENELKDIKDFKNRIFQYLQMPPSNVYMKQIGLTEKEIYGFKGNENLLDVTKPELASYIKKIMEDLGKKVEYEKNVNMPFTEHEIATQPILNYDHKMEEKPIDSKVIKLLEENEFLKFDRERGGVLDEDAKIGNIVAILSSHKSNFDPGKMGIGAVEQILRRNISKSAKVYPLHVGLDRFNVNIYSLMIGLQPWAPAPGYLPRLKDLDRMMKIYEEATDEQLFLHHSLFMGDFKAFSELTKETIMWGDKKDTISSVIQYWKNYEIIDKTAKWKRVPITIAEILTNVEELDNKLANIQPRLMILSKNLPSQFSQEEVSKIRDHIQNVCKDLKELEKSVRDYTTKFNEGKTYISMFILQLNSEDSIANKDSAKIKNFLEIATNRISKVQSPIHEIGTLLRTDLSHRLQTIEDYINSVPIEHLTPLLEKQKREINVDIGDIRPRLPNIGKDLTQIGVPLEDIQKKISILAEKLS